MDILNGNIIIAGFMDLQIEESSKELFYLTENRKINNVWTIQAESWGCVPEELPYHLSWDWLMPVIEKIQQIADKPEIYLDDYYMIDFDLNLAAAICELRIDGKLLESRTAFEPDILINAVYPCVVAFIKWYNKHKK